MSYTTVDVQILKQIDRLAKMRQLYAAAVVGGTDLWWLVDAANDATYEDICKVQSMTNVDTALNNANFGSSALSWFNLHNSYFSTAGYTNLAGYLNSLHLRVPEDFSAFYTNAIGSTLTAKYVFADQSKTANVLGTLAVGGTGDSLTSLATTFGDTRLVAKVTTMPTGGDLVFDITVRATDGTDITYTGLTIPQYSAVGTEKYIGRRQVYSIDDSNAAYTDIYLDTTATGFVATNYSLLENNEGSYTYGYGYSYAGYVQSYEDFFDIYGTLTDDIKEYLLISSVSSNRVRVAKLYHTYSNLEYCRLWPCFRQVYSLSLNASSTATTGAISIVPLNDRQLVL